MELHVLPTCLLLLNLLLLTTCQLWLGGLTLLETHSSHLLDCLLRHTIGIFDINQPGNSFGLLLFLTLLLVFLITTLGFLFLLIGTFALTIRFFLQFLLLLLSTLFLQFFRIRKVATAPFVIHKFSSWHS
uniref:Uncharacterized protein n=1 Tax=Lutzomyia longipalpis TaxID=7200 RepID=A0A7G3B6V5_LUTLO